MSRTHNFLQGRLFAPEAFKPRTIYTKQLYTKKTFTPKIPCTYSVFGPTLAANV